MVVSMTANQLWVLKVQQQKIKTFSESLSALSFVIAHHSISCSPKNQCRAFRLKREWSLTLLFLLSLFFSQLPLFRLLFYSTGRCPFGRTFVSVTAVSQLYITWCYLYFILVTFLNLFYSHFPSLCVFRSCKFKLYRDHFGLSFFFFFFFFFTVCCDCLKQILFLICLHLLSGVFVIQHLNICIYNYIYD